MRLPKESTVFKGRSRKPVSATTFWSIFAWVSAEQASDVSPPRYWFFGLQGHHVEVLAHAVAGDHGAGQLGGLLDVVGRAGGDGAEHHLLGGAAAGEGGDLVLQLLLVHQVVVALVHLHGVAQRAGGAGDDGDLLHGGGVGLLGRHQGVADLVVGHDALFVVGQDGVLLLVAGNDHLDALLQVGLGHARRPSRTARSAASLTMLASSAPDAPEAMRAIVLKSTSSGRS